mgnify:CR=1 FL=1
MLNMNFEERLVIETAQLSWQDSPMQGVQRKPLERSAPESGHVTSVVKYEKGAKFSEHTHPLGEEIFVLEGVFSDEHGDYPQGTYLRNPPGSKHSPFSVEGCTLLVKLNQFSPQDLSAVRINTQTTQWLPGMGGLQVMPLHDFSSAQGSENAALVKWPAGEVFQPHRHFGGEEIFVLSGEFKDEHGSYPKHSWLRSPHMSQHHPFVTEETVILVKTGHLPF